MEDLPGEHVSEEQFTDEHGNIVTKKVSHHKMFVHCIRKMGSADCFHLRQFYSYSSASLNRNYCYTKNIVRLFTYDIAMDTLNVPKIYIFLC